MKVMHYWVDWADMHFPKIVSAVADSPETATSFTEAKRELLEDLEDRIDHWKGVKRMANRLRKGDVESVKPEKT